MISISQLSLSRSSIYCHRPKRLLLVVLLVLSCSLVDSISYMSTKKIGCGSIDIDEIDNSNHQNYHRHHKKHRQTSLPPLPRLVSNLTNCLHLTNEHNFTSFRSLHGSKLATHLFDTYFNLNETNGLVYLRHEIDRERLCADVKSMLTMANTIATSVTSTTTTSLMIDSSVNCDCKSEICELNFKFIGFKDASASFGAAKRRRIQHYYQTSEQEYKYLSLRVNVRDLNDHRPKFHKALLNLNITEHFGQEPIRSTTTTTVSDENKLECISQKLNSLSNPAKSYDDEDFNSLLALDKAYDLDAGRNARIDYRLYLLRSPKPGLVDELMFDSGVGDEMSNSDRVRKFLSGDGEIRSCVGLFQLVEAGGSGVVGRMDESSSNYDMSSSTTNIDDTYQQATVNYRKWANRGTALTVNNNEQLFLKVNTFLDREVQQVCLKYHF